jgi:hypothetical protein
MYKIEITADTLSELAGKAMSLAVKLNTATESGPVVKGATHVVTYEVAPAVVEAAPEVAEEAPAPLPSSGQTEAPPITEEKVSASSPTEASDAQSDTLNFDTDVAPIVLQVVKDKGKPVVQAILEQFGVERASQLDPARWPELIAQLKDAL